MSPQARRLLQQAVRELLLIRDRPPRYQRVLDEALEALSVPKLTLVPRLEPRDETKEGT